MEYTKNNSISSEKKCIICDNLIENESKNHHPLLKELIEKNQDKCDKCLEKIYTIKAYIDIKKHIPVKAGEYKKISNEFDKDKLDYYFSILKKHNLIKSINQDVFFLKEEDDFYETENYKKYSQFLKETFKKEVQQNNFDNLDLIIQDELESEKRKQNNNDINDSIEYTVGEKITENLEQTEDEDIENKKETSTPPTVKHINLSNLLSKKTKQKAQIQETTDFTDVNAEKNSIPDKLVVEKVDKDKIIEETKLDEEVDNEEKPIISEIKEESQNKPLPQIKHINLSNLLGKKESEPKTKEDADNNIKESETKVKEEVPKEEPITIETSEFKIKNQEYESKSEPITKTETINKSPKSKSEYNKKYESKKEHHILEEETTIENNNEIKNEPIKKDIDEIDDLFEEVISAEGKHRSENKNKTKNINDTDFIDEKPKIPPKKSNGQYSLHKGISYKIGVFKWTADIRERGKLKSLGLFNTEEEAYLARQEYINKKNLNTQDSMIPPKKSNNRYSLHDRVDYDLDKSKWFAYIHEYGEEKFLGYFDSEKEAYSSQCKYLNIFVPTKQKNGQYSLHNGVSFNKRYCKWTATIRGRKRNKFLGYFCSELDALKAIEVYSESKGQILNIWNPPKELSDDINVESNDKKFTKNFSYEMINENYIHINLNAKIRDDNELFKVLYKLNSFYIKISSLEVKDMGNFISLRASFKIKSDVLNKFIIDLKEDGWVK